MKKILAILAIPFLLCGYLYLAPSPDKPARTYVTASGGALANDIDGIIARGAHVLNILDWGASTSASAADNTTAIHNAIDDMVAGDTLLIPSGSFAVTNVVFDPPAYCKLIMCGELVGTTTGVALAIGPSNSAPVEHYELRGIRVRSESYDCTAGRVGLQLRSLKHYQVYLTELQGFEKGLEIAPTSPGYNSYGSIHGGYIINNKYGIYMDPVAPVGSAYITEVAFWRPWVSMSDAGWAALGDPAGATFLYCSDNTVDSNTFYSPLLEGNTNCIAAQIYGSCARLLDVYLEGPGGAPSPGDLTKRILLKSTSRGCKVTIRNAQVAIGSPDVYHLKEYYVTDEGVGNSVEVLSDNVDRPQILYVASDGSDTNSGRSESAPLLTIAKASDLARPGDRVLVRRGSTFTETLTPAKYVVYDAYGDPTKPLPVFKALSITGQTWGVYRISRIRFTNSSGVGITITANRELSSCYQFLAVLTECEAVSCSSLGANIAFNAAHNGGDVVLRACKVLSNGSHGIYFATINGTEQSLLLDRCLTYGNNGSGIAGSDVAAVDSVVVQNCVSYGNSDHGAQFTSSAIGVKIYNNTFVANTSLGLWVAATSTSCDIRNNICAYNGGNEAQYDAGSESGATFDYNDYYDTAGTFVRSNGVSYTSAQLANYIAAEGGANELFSLPGFVSKDSYNYALLAGGACVDSGATIAAVTLDYNGSPRPSGAYNRGAFESLDSSQFTRIVSPILLGTVSATGDGFIFSSGSAGIVEKVQLITDASVAIDGTNYWSANIRNLTKAVNLLSAAKTTFTGGTAITGDVPWEMVPDQNTVVADKDVLEIQFTKTNAPADLTRCTIVVHVKAAE